LHNIILVTINRVVAYVLLKSITISVYYWAIYLSIKATQRHTHT